MGNKIREHRVTTPPATATAGSKYFVEANGKVSLWVAGNDGNVRELFAGARWFNGATTPAGSLGVVGDYYLRTTGEYYEKTGVSTWTSRGSLKGLTGATGPAGPAGPTGATGPQGQPGDPNDDQSLDDVLTIGNIASRNINMAANQLQNGIGNHGLTMLPTGGMSLKGNGVSSITGVNFIEYFYTVGHRLNTIGALRGSSNHVLAYGVEPNTAVSGQYVSTADNVAWPRSTLEIGNQLTFKGLPSSAHPIGAVVEMEDLFRVNTDGRVYFPKVRNTGPATGPQEGVTAINSSGELIILGGGISAGIINDGTGSGLDADLLDGQHGSHYIQNLQSVLSQGQTHFWGSNIWLGGNNVRMTDVNLYNVLADAARKYTVTATPAPASGLESIFDGNDNSFAEWSVSGTINIKVDLFTKGNSGITYPQGKVYATFYARNIPSAAPTLKLTYSTGSPVIVTGVNISSSSILAVYDFTTPANVFLGEMELEFQAGGLCRLSELAFVPSRDNPASVFQQGKDIVTHRDISVRDSDNVERIKLSPAGPASLTVNSGDVVIGSNLLRRTATGADSFNINDQGFFVATNGNLWGLKDYLVVPQKVGSFTSTEQGFGVHWRSLTDAEGTKNRLFIFSQEDYSSGGNQAQVAPAEYRVITEQDFSVPVRKVVTSTINFSENFSDASELSKTLADVGLYSFKALFRWKRAGDKGSFVWMPSTAGIKAASSFQAAVGNIGASFQRAEFPWGSTETRLASETNAFVFEMIGQVDVEIPNTEIKHSFSSGPSGGQLELLRGTYVEYTKIA